MTAFVNLVLTLDVAPIFIGGRLLMASQRIRLIAISFTLRRLASKCTNSVGTSPLSKPFLYFHQLSVGVTRGCEAAAFTVRAALPADHVLAKSPTPSTLSTDVTCFDGS